ncbi:MAG TPA: 4-alpha-glucanotransferase [Phycisphaerales bacterium]|nr:4-alpha-glucanotransferase [Phycisphaerales bacterium]
MLGWEFPPFISGGLGTACYGLTKAMSHCGTEIAFVLPTLTDGGSVDYMKILNADGISSSQKTEFKNVRFITVSSPLKPYISVETRKFFAKNVKKCEKICTFDSNFSKNEQNYGENIYEQVNKYAEKVSHIADVETFDVVHSHDWMTFPAGVAAAQNSGKPLVVHVHSTEFDRSGENINQTIYDIERYGMYEAQKIVAVSHYTRNMIINRYGVSAEKITVVHNGIENDNPFVPEKAIEKRDKIVLFLGRITFQKGPDYFIAAAKKVLEKISNVKFIMAGDGDMLHRMIEYAAELGIGHKVFFTKFLRGANVEKMYRMADLYVMPSVSEPFGIAPLEAVKNNVPVLISKQSGISEILANALKVDFWDVNQMANKMTAALKYPPMSQTLRENSRNEIKKFRWEDVALKVNEIYKQILTIAA